MRSRLDKRALCKSYCASEAWICPCISACETPLPFWSIPSDKWPCDGVQRALGFILSSHRTEASWDRYQKNVADARLEIGRDAPEIDYCAGWHDHPLVYPDLVRANQRRLCRDCARANIRRLLSFSPRTACRSRWLTDRRTSNSLRSLRVPSPKRSATTTGPIAYQSRSGKPGDAWLEPDINLVIRDLSVQAATDVVIAPIGFVCDHVEVLYDLDIEAKKTAAQAGIKLHRASCPNDHTTFIQMIADVIVRSVQARQ